ncbi:hypothetical protein BZG36_01921 [Bifiguratus adelaidae]|uniref:Late endosomal/lysosomal adaptor and MAPK and MTOR activator 1 n=1 Tax=Bifiguratus adelaidae TaxID=1938954 RepID=A0A261Y4L0_9FUNG|nr:hypothetical protein BZG36_01921 [Bifiguratus adelaidae]
MGCCGSKQEQPQYDAETQRLLPDNVNEAVIAETAAYPRYNAVSQEYEQASLKHIVNRTQDNFIDTSFNHGEAMQQHDAVERTNIYKAAVDQLEVAQAEAQVEMEPCLASSVLPGDILAKPPTLDAESEEWLNRTMDDIANAMDSIEVKDVGNIVVPLTFTN